MQKGRPRRLFLEREEGNCQEEEAGARKERRCHGQTPGPRFYGIQNGTAIGVTRLHGRGPKVSRGGQEDGKAL